MASDPLSSAVSSILWPYLKGEGFVKSTNRRFAREKNGVIQQVWVDANGVAKARSTRIVLCCTFPFASPEGYMDPHGFIIKGGRHFDMSTEVSAEKSMNGVVSFLRESELSALERLSSLEYLVASLKPLPNREWHATYSQLAERWSKGDAELKASAESVRSKLKL